MEKVVWEESLHDEIKGLGAEWTWVREEEDSWRIAEGEGLVLDTLHGGIWNDSMKPAKNILIREWPISWYEEKPLAVEVRVRVSTICWGEQAGLVLYNADDDWVKLVIEGSVGSLLIFSSSFWRYCLVT